MEKSCSGSLTAGTRGGVSPRCSLLEDEGARVTSRRLGWNALHFEHREIAASRRHVSADGSRHLVFVMLEGGVLTRESEEGKARHELTPGFVVLAPRGYPVRWSWDSRLSFSLLALQPGFLTQVAKQCFGFAADEARLMYTETKHDSVITSIAASVAREAMQFDAASASCVESLAQILAVHLLRNYQPGSAAPATPSKSNVVPRAISRALKFIHQNHAKNVSLADIASAARVSRFHLSRVFRNTLGVTLQQYLIEIRVRHAHALIVAGGGQYSLADIAVAAGFADQSHLTRHFKRQVGTTPKKAA